MVASQEEHMPVKSKDLHGNVPDQSGAALLLIDVVNDFEFEGGEKLLPLALPVGKAIARTQAGSKAGRRSRDLRQ